MRSVVIDADQTFAKLICPCCEYILEEFHSESLWQPSPCPNCFVYLELSDYQELYNADLKG